MLDKETIGFDPHWYVSNHADVARAIETGAVQGAWEHYLAIGRPEGRRPFAFDEAWYLNKYPDAGRAIAKGACLSALTHYINAGRREGSTVRQKWPRKAP